MKKRKYFVFFAFILISLSSNYAFANSVIKGRITDRQTGRPLVNANISIESTSIGTTSDKDGNFRITNLPPGKYVVKVNYMGYQPYEKSISLVLTKSLFLDIKLESIILPGESVTVTARAAASKAVKRETPIAFTNLELKELKHNYTTGDLPELIQNVPGVWTSSAGLGESEIMLRGFPADKIRFMINGVPMNEPEDQNVYWSNWASLANSVYSIEVQRGPGFSLFGAGAFGGTIQIETMGISLEPSSTFRFSSGGYRRMGIESGSKKGKIYNNKGTGIEDVASANNYTYSAQLNSGALWNGKLNISAFLEYKAGDSYILGTTYDGYSFGIEAQSILGRHKLRATYFYAPQEHNQAFALQDIDLLKTLGREYNRMNHEWQENYYRKPFLTFKHEWNISEKLRLVNNAFATTGKGADQTCMNSIFNVEDGKTDFQQISQARDVRAFGEHAMFLLDNFELMTTDLDTAYIVPFCPYSPPSFKGFSFTDDTTNFFADQLSHSWQNRKRRDHAQLGLSSYIQYELAEWIQLIAGGEGRIWRGHRESEAWFLRYSDLWVEERQYWASLGEINPLGKFQSIYNYDTRVNNFSAFGRTSVKPLDWLTIQAGGQYSYTQMKVIEIPVQFMDFGKFEFFDLLYRTSADQVDESGNKKFTDDDYRRTYKYFCPWIGANINMGKHFNLFTNYAMSKKEPAILNWYDFDKGPIKKDGDDSTLKPESVNNCEVGIGFNSLQLKTNVNYYYTVYDNKIESVVDINDRYQTLNAGKAIYQGLELEFSGVLDKLDFAGSATIAKNRWKKMDAQEIFGSSADEVVGKVVPFSPERIFTFLCGYRFMPYPKHQYRFGLKLYYWDEYYGTYTNQYTKANGTTAFAKLPYFLNLSANLSFTMKLPKVDITFRLDANNIFNRSDNFVRAQYTIDYTRTDDLAGKYNWYVLQAPLFNIFFTTEFAIR
jgi:outer membrane receptor protein involved in Fe transport